MPQFDQTGPEGKGPLTGRGMGKCSSKNTASPSQNAKTKSKKGNK